MLDYDIEISPLADKDKVFVGGSLGNYRCNCHNMNETDDQWLVWLGLRWFWRGTCLTTSSPTTFPRVSLSWCPGFHSLFLQMLFLVAWLCWWHCSWSWSTSSTTSPPTHPRRRVWLLLKPGCWPAFSLCLPLWQSTLDFSFTRWIFLLGKINIR